MNENCSQCRCEPDGTPWYYLSQNDEKHSFCSRRCLVEFIAPELKQAVAIKQWIPTAEDEERMRQ